jgi:hypothetical protein
MLWSVKSVKKPVWKLGYEAVSEVSDFKNNRAHEEWFSTVSEKAGLEIGL